MITDLVFEQIVLECIPNETETGLIEIHARIHRFNMAFELLMRN